MRLGAAALLLALAGCGGGGAGTDAAATGAGAGGTVLGGAGAGVGAGGGVVDGLATRDEHSFAAAWVAHTLLGHLPHVFRLVERTGACSGGGSAQYDASTGVSTLNACRLLDQPDLAYTGSVTTGASTTDTAPGARHVSAAQFSVINLANNNSQVSVVSSGPGLDYTLVSLSSGDDVGWSAPGLDSLDFTLGGSTGTRHLRFSNVARVLTQFTGSGMNFVRTSTPSQFGFSNGTDTWQFTASSAIREAAGSQPDTGSFALLRQGASLAQTLNISLKVDGVITFGQGEDGKTVSRSWSDSALLSALTAAQR
jgi:hypothetical protein